MEFHVSHHNWKTAKDLFEGEFDLFDAEYLPVWRTSIHEWNGLNLFYKFSKPYPKEYLNQVTSNWNENFLDEPEHLEHLFSSTGLLKTFP